MPYDGEVLLKNGYMEIDVITEQAIEMLKLLAKEHYVALVELVKLANDPAHEPWNKEQTYRLFQECSFLDPASSYEHPVLHSSVINVVQSAVKMEDNGLKVTISSPLSEKRA